MCRRVHLFIIGKTRQKLEIVLAQVFFPLHTKGMCAFRSFLFSSRKTFNPLSLNAQLCPLDSVYWGFSFFEILLSSSFLLTTLMKEELESGNDSHRSLGEFETVFKPYSMVQTGHKIVFHA